MLRKTQIMMEKETNEILFNKKGKNGIVKKNAQDARKLFQLLHEHASQDTKCPEAIINLYTHKVQTSKIAIENKLSENKLRPFEFYVINN